MAGYSVYKVWDGEILHNACEISHVAGGIKWYGPGVGSGWVAIDPDHKWGTTKIPETDMLLEVVDEFSF